MNPIAPSFLIGSSSFWKTIRLQMSSKGGNIQPETAELAALKRLENPHRLIMGKML